MRRHANNPEANYLVSVELSRTRERLAEARDHAERAVAAEPSTPRYRHQLALTLMRLNDLEVAEAELRHAIELDPSVHWWKYQLAQVLFRLRKYERCCDLLAEYLERQPHSSDGWQLLGRCREVLGDVEEAARAFQRAADARSDWAWPLLKLANLRIGAGTKPEQGLAATDRLLEIIVEPRQRGEVHLLRAQLYEIEQRLGKAVDAASRSVELCPDWDWAKTVRARLVAREARSVGKTASRPPERAAS
jgi:predicted Zn-dependent protease